MKNGYGRVSGESEPWALLAHYPPVSIKQPPVFLTQLKPQSPNAFRFRGNASFAGSPHGAESHFARAMLRPLPAWDTSAHSDLCPSPQKFPGPGIFLAGSLPEGHGLESFLEELQKAPFALAAARPLLAGARPGSSLFSTDKIGRGRPSDRCWVSSSPSRQKCRCALTGPVAASETLSHLFCRFPFGNGNGGEADTHSRLPGGNVGIKMQGDSPWAPGPSHCCSVATPSSACAT